MGRRKRAPRDVRARLRGLSDGFGIWLGRKFGISDSFLGCERLAQLRNSGRDWTRDRRLAWALDTVLDSTLAPEDHAYLAEIFLAGIRFVDEKERDRLLGRLHILALSSNELGRHIFWDTSLSFEDRVRLFPAMRSAELLTFARVSPLTSAQRAQLADEICKRYFPWSTSLTAMVCRSAEANDGAWRAILETPALRSENPADLLEAFVHEDTAGIVSRMTLTGCQVAIYGAAPEHIRQLLRKLADLSTTSLRWEDQRARLHEILQQTIHAAVHNPTHFAPLRSVIADETVPTEFRVDAVRAFPYNLIENYSVALWKCAGAAPTLRAALLRRFVEAHYVAEDLLSELPDEPGARDEQRWRKLADLDRLFTARARDLVSELLTPDAPEFVRRTAILQLEQRVSRGRISARDRKQVWDLALSDDGAALWRHAELKALLPDLLCANSPLHAVIAAGPEGPLWQCVASLAMLPDRGLASLALEKLPLPENLAHFQEWQRRFPHLPDAGVLALYQIVGNARPGDDEKIAATLDRVFATTADRAEKADLLANLTRVAMQGRSTVERVADVLAPEGGASSETPATLRQLVLYAALEARLRQDDADETAFSDLDAIVDARDAVAAMRAAVVHRVRTLLPKLSVAQISRVLAETPAPAVLAVHYQQMHPESLPLLSAALAATSAGPKAWKAWRFDRPEASEQLSHLSDPDVAIWREDLSLVVEAFVVPASVESAASAIRARLREAIHREEIPESYLSLICQGQASPATTIAGYRDLIDRVIGPALGGTSAEIPPDLRAVLPADLSAEVRDATTRRDRAALLALRSRCARAIDLLRLLHCDAVALARNEFRVDGETATARKGERAVAHLNHLAFAFREDPLRAKRSGGDSSEDSPITLLVDDLRTILRGVEGFAPKKTLVAEERSDLKTLIEIGHRPYGQGSCQDYESAGSINTSLLAYVVDAMTKAIVIRSAPTSKDPEGTVVARSIVRVGEGSDGKPVLVLERTYAAGGDEAIYRPMIQEAARNFAARRGWQLAETPTAETDTASLREVYIPASQNGVQYEDGGGGERSGDYFLGVQYVSNATEAVTASA